MKDPKTGKFKNFDIISEKDLPFLNENTEFGSRIRRYVIDKENDDDFMTDEEIIKDAKELLSTSLEEAIK